MLRLLGILTLGNLLFGDGRHARHGGLLGGLFFLPALLFGGWIAVAVVCGVLSLVAAVIGGVFSGLASLASGAFSGGGVLLGIVIGLAAFYGFRSRRVAETADGRE